MRHTRVDLISTLVSFGILLTGCTTTPYQAFNDKSSKPRGYYSAVLSENNQPTKYQLYYYGDGTTVENTSFWNKRAKELCKLGYQIVSHEQKSVRKPIETMVNGIMVSVSGKGYLLDSGTIECKLKS